MKSDCYTTSFTVPVCLYLACFAACSDGPSAVSLPSVDATDAASFAVDHYDSDDNGSIDASELGQCPPLAAALTSYDADNNGQLSREEIEDRINRLYSRSAGLISAECIVTLNNQPLRGATVKFRPAEMLGPSVKTAQGITNSSGVARVTLDDEELPDDLRDAPLAHPGLYHVEITHPEVALPERYNKATELGFEIDPANEHTGSSARFDLKLK